MMGRRWCWEFCLALALLLREAAVGHVQLMDERLTKDAIISKMSKELADTKEKLHEVHRKLSVANQTIASLRGGVRQPDSPSPEGFSGHKLVHLDLGGAPPKIDYLIKLLPFFRTWGATGLLVEYADTFPYSGDLQVVHSPSGYSKTEIHILLEKARQFELVVIPLVQTFGHLEFLLKHKKFAHLRETADFTNSLCPNNEGSIKVVREMIDQILKVHSDAKWFHVGGDEVWNMETCDDCKRDKRNETMLFLHHMRPVLEHVRGKNVVPLLWDDMMRDWDEDSLKVVADLAEPMVWYYRTDLGSHFSKDMWKRYTSVFPRLWFAGAFKGATEPNADFVPIAPHIKNTLQWMGIMSRLPSSTHCQGFALTGWSRYDHYGTLCELLPAGLPSLAICLDTLDKGYTDRDHIKAVSQKLGFDQEIDVSGDNSFSKTAGYGNFPGHEIYRLVYKLKEAQERLQHAHSTEKGWLLDRQIESNFLSVFRLQSARWALLSALSLLNQILDEAETLLPTIYSDETVEEWIKDKVTDSREHAEKQKAAIEEYEQRTKASLQA